MLFEINLIVLFVSKYIPPALLAELEENEEFINYSIILLVFMFIIYPEITLLFLNMQLFMLFIMLF